MKRLQAVIAGALVTKSPVLAARLVVADPHVEMTIPLVDVLVRSGVVLIEFVLPFGPPYRQSTVADAGWERGLDAEVLAVDAIAIINSLRQSYKHLLFSLDIDAQALEDMGVERFMQRAAAIGLDGLCLRGIEQNSMQAFQQSIRDWAIPLVVSPQQDRALEGTIAYCRGVDNDADYGLQMGYVDVLEDLSSVLANSNVNGIILRDLLQRVINSNINNPTALFRAVKIAILEVQEQILLIGDKTQ